MAGKLSDRRLKWFVTIVVLGFVGFQLYNGVFLDRLTVPGLVEFEFGDGQQRCAVLDEPAFDNVQRAVGMSRDAIARGDYPTDTLATLNYREVLISELRRKGGSDSELSGLGLRALVLRARAECILP